MSGKNGLLFQIAEASLDHPEEPVKEVVYPIANESTLRDLVREFKATGPAYRQQLHTVMRTAYRSHYRSMLMRLLDTLEFRSNNESHRPVLDALAIVKKYADSRLHVYPLDESPPVKGIVRGPWLETVREKDENGAEDARRARLAMALPRAASRHIFHAGKCEKDLLLSLHKFAHCLMLRSVSAFISYPHNGHRIAYRYNNIHSVSKHSR